MSEIAMRPPGGGKGMEIPLTTHIFYNYEEHRCVLEIRYDPKTNEIRILGGRHSFARLAELFAIFAQAAISYEDSNWFSVKGDLHQLIVVLKNDLQRE
jgi:hypothetical protein